MRHFIGDCVSMGNWCSVKIFDSKEHKYNLLNSEHSDLSLVGDCSVAFIDVCYASHGPMPCDQCLVSCDLCHNWCCISLCRFFGTFNPKEVPADAHTQPGV